MHEEGRSLLGLGPRRIVAVSLLTLTALTMAAMMLRATPIVRGKSAAVPLSDELTPEQQIAEDAALSDSRVQALTAGKRSEVFGVREVTAGQFTPASAACAAADCRQVEIYLFDENAAVLAIVNVESREVLDVLHQPGVHPGISKKQAERAIALALESPEVIEMLGFRPLHVDMAPVPADMPGTSCTGDHYCVGPNFEVRDRSLWVIVDLTLGEIAAIFWGEPMPPPLRNPIPSLPHGCPQPGSVNRDGWELSYAATGTDGLRLNDVRYNGVAVLTSVKNLNWHVQYNPYFGYRDEPGCGSGGGGFQIQPYGETQVITMTNASGASIGFEIIQDFRMSRWGDSCNYRYENRLQFFADGRFRIGSAAYGRGCNTNGIYRPVVRIDVAVDGDDGDTFGYLDESGWHDVITETYRTPYAETGHGPHHFNASGSAWRILDEGGSGYYIVADRGQYPHSRGDTPYLYVTRHHSAEGDTDMGAIGQCCSENHVQGPDRYLDGEDVSATNIVLWYVGQMQTTVDAADGGPYCWTAAGEPDPESYPCITGPLFQPFTPRNTLYFPLAPID